MTDTPTILVSGATGLQGGAVALALLERGATVRALTRDPGSEPAGALVAAGADVVAGDFDDPSSLEAAAAGADAVFVMGTPFGTDPETEVRQASELIDAAERAGVGHIAYSSVASALEDTGIPHFDSKAEIEHHLSEVAVPHTVIAPVAFLAEIDEGSLEQNALPAFAPRSVPLQQVAVEDLGAFAALVLTQPDRFAGARIEIASLEASAAEVAAAATRRLGRTIEPHEVPLDVVREQGGEDFVRMVEFFAAGGYSVDIPALHAAYPEIAWTGLEEWITEQVG